MSSKRPHSTVSFNTQEGLQTALHILKPEFWFYIHHFPENYPFDEHDKKEHFHVYLDFGRSFDPITARDAFVEPDPCNPKPKHCNPLRPSKFEDAFLYFIHDKSYLAAKNLVKQYHYSTTEVVTNEPDYLAELMNTIDYRKYQRADYISIVEKAYNMGVRDFGTLVVMYRPPIAQYGLWQKLWCDYTSYRFQLEKDPSMRCNVAWADLATERSHMRLEAKQAVTRETL